MPVAGKEPAHVEERLSLETPLHSPPKGSRFTALITALSSRMLKSMHAS